MENKFITSLLSRLNKVHEADELTPEQHSRFLTGIKHVKEVTDFISDEAPNTATPEVQGTRRADGSSSARPLDVGDKDSASDGISMHGPHA